MSDSLLDETLRFCHDALLDMPDTHERAAFRGRLGVLERAVWSLSLVPTTTTRDQALAVATMVLRLRDDIAGALDEESEDPCWASVRATLRRSRHADHDLV